ncbi:MAG: GNAT family N-acetyltransferase [Kordiimonadaceae bacterium]|nr:GNAT family N-acetyltransferase [Kordiimonadaceae bacterium]MBO6568873.1 GNAT family N-acetyltransferase [Kordiimonadaceae bacterium]MBO6965152.1 GNAT family N-acetyltransferase [Kordiimonadaceae bacterium]
MTSLEFSVSSADTIADMEQTYLNACAAPLDGMWQSFVEMAEIIEISHGQSTIGYAAINGDKELLRFHVDERLDPLPILKSLIDAQSLVGAVVSTAEPRALACLLDVQATLSVSAIMYHMPSLQTELSAAFPTGTELRPVDANALEQVADFGHRTLGASLDWLLSYFSGLIGRGELYALWRDNEILSTGECRRNNRQPLVADVGMIVGKAHRRQGIATAMLRALAQKARDQKLAPICSTETDNLGAQKAIIAAGFVGYHRIVNVRF